MSEIGSLRIVNSFTKPITISVDPSTCHCCDHPIAGQIIGTLDPHQSTVFQYARTDGHGCNGKQGQFVLVINSTMTVGLNFDSNAVMSNPISAGCNAGLSAVNVLTVSE